VAEEGDSPNAASRLDAVRTAKVLNVDCYCGDPLTAADLVINLATEGAGGYFCLCNVHVIVAAQRSARVLDALSSATLVLPDGAPVAWLARCQGATSARRVAGPDLMQAVLGRGIGKGLRHFLFGSDSATLVLLRQRIESAGAIVAGSLAPPFATLDALEDTALIDAINSTRPHVVWCGLGAPKQELWMLRNAARVHPAVVVGVGAAFDFLGGSKRRAPRWLQGLGLEWLHRLSTEPRRLGPRYLITNSRFLIQVVNEFTLGRRRTP